MYCLYRAGASPLHYIIVKKVKRGLYPNKQIPSWSRKHIAHHKRTSPSKDFKLIVFIVFVVLWSLIMCHPLFNVSCVFYNKY